MIICIIGKAQHGKDSTARFIQQALEKRRNKVLITHFGDLLKYICRQFFDWDGEKDDPGRYLLQQIGTDVIRAQNPNYWVDFLKGILTMFPQKWDYVLIPDCRFPNEIEELKNNGFQVITLRVFRPNFISPLTEDQQKHPSETSLEKYCTDWMILNNGTLEDLSGAAYMFLNFVKAANCMEND